VTVSSAEELRVRTPVFEGPIDLLLTLAQRHQVDMSQLKLGDLTSEYLGELAAREDSAQKDPERLAAFLLVGSKLLALKAAALLPGVMVDEAEQDLESWEERVKQRLEEYRRFKEVASRLMERHREGGPSFTAAIEGEIVPRERIEIEPGALAAAFQTVLDRLPPPDEVRVELQNYSLSDEMDKIRSRIAGGATVHFTEFFAEAATRLHAVVIFLAMLELVRLGELSFRQRQAFGEIELSAAAT